jgi:hypothetical protein
MITIKLVLFIGAAALAFLSTSVALLGTPPL